MSNDTAPLRRIFTVLACTATPIGAFALFAPATLLVDVKDAAASGSAIAMARTVGALLIAVGVLDFLVRDHPPSATLKAVLWFNLLLQTLILPLDPLAYAEGAFGSLGAFVPNTLLHVGLIGVLAYQARRARRWSR